jgi:hypothetical protein
MAPLRQAKEGIGIVPTSEAMVPPLAPPIPAVSLPSPDGEEPGVRAAGTGGAEKK